MQYPVSTSVTMCQHSTLVTIPSHRDIAMLTHAHLSQHTGRLTLKAASLKRSILVGQASPAAFSLASSSGRE